MYTCPRCEGRKIMTEYAKIYSGICFRCEGTGEVDELTELEVHEQKQICDIFNLALEADGYMYLRSFHIWGAEGSGHYFCHKIDQTIDQQYDITTPMLRKLYKQAIIDGYTPMTAEQFKRWDYDRSFL